MNSMLYFSSEIKEVAQKKSERPPTFFSGTFPMYAPVSDLVDTMYGEYKTDISFTVAQGTLS